MTEHALSLANVYSEWADFQQELLAVVEPLTAEQLALPVSSNHWPLGLLTQHIINDRIWWFHLWMDEGSPDVTSHMHWEWEDEGTHIPTHDELVAGLRASWEMVAATLARWTVADLDHVFEPPASLSEDERRRFGPNTRKDIILHVFRHDLHHGGELSVGLGAHGLKSIWGF